MTLNTHLHLGTPLIWVNSDEPERVIDDVILQARREVFQLDPFEGLVVWKNNAWRKVLVVLPDGSEGSTFKFEVAFQHVYENDGVFIISNAHKVAEDLLGMFSGLYGKYRNSYKTNSADHLPCQLVLISCTGEIPPEISRHVAIVDHELPNGPELAAIATDISNNIEGGVLGEDASAAKIVKAGLGLSESEFMQASLLSVKDSGIIDPKSVNEFKMAKIKSGGVLEIRNPVITLDDIGGLDRAKEIINAIVWTWTHPEQAKEFSITPIRRILMIGVPGTGKSAICEATAKTLDLELAKFGVTQMMNKFIGESENNMRLAFRQIRAMAPLVCWMDELGRDLSGSGSQNDAGTTDRVHGELLTGIQELPDNVLLMAAANRIDGIPPEMLRADRFDKIMFVGFPSLEERVDIFRIHLGKLASEFDLEACAQTTNMFTGAEIKSLIQEVRFNVSTSQKRAITTQDVVSAAPNQKNRLWIKHQPEMLAMYKRAVVEWDWASSQQRQDAELVISGQVGLHKSTPGNTVYQGI